MAGYDAWLLYTEGQPTATNAAYGPAAAHYFGSDADGLVLMFTFGPRRPTLVGCASARLGQWSPRPRLRLGGNHF